MMRSLASHDDWIEHVHRTGEHLHVYLNGEDVTRRCYRAVFHENRVEGDVWLYVQREGRAYFDPDLPGVPRELRTGLMSIQAGAHFY